MTSGVPGLGREGDVLGAAPLVEVLAAGDPLVLTSTTSSGRTACCSTHRTPRGWVRGAPVLMITLARPELETRSDLVTVGGWVTEAVPAAQAGGQRDSGNGRTGAGQRPDCKELRAAALDGGNPLFAGNWSAYLDATGCSLSRRKRRWTPPTSTPTNPGAAGISPRTTQTWFLAMEILSDQRSRLPASKSPGMNSSLQDHQRSMLCSIGCAGSASQTQRTYAPMTRRCFAARADPRRRHRRLLKSRAGRSCTSGWRTGWRPAAPTWRSNPTRWSPATWEAAQGYRSDLGLRDAHSAELALRSARSPVLGARARP